MIPDYPTTRTEAYLAAILGGDGALPVPESRTDLYLAKIAGMDTEIPDDPQTRSEKYLAAILGADLVLPAPLSRKDFYLAKKAGMDVEIPEPLTRLEAYLAEWAGEPSGQWKTVTGSLIHITDALASPVNALSVNIDPVQSGSGDPSPDNVRPISGWTGAKVWRTGTNIWDGQYEAGKWFNDQNGTITSANGYNLTSLIPIKPGAKYYHAKSGSVRTLPYDKDGNVITGSWVNLNGEAAWTAPSGVYGLRITVTDTQLPLFFVNYPDTDHDAHTYSGTTIPITFPTPPGTVYGGTLDVLSGVLTVERAKYAYQGTEEARFWQQGNNANRIGFNLADGRLPATAAERLEATANIAKPSNSLTSSAKNYQVGEFCLYDNSGTCVCMTAVPLTCADATSAKAWLAEQGFEVCYPLATPQTYQLTAQEVSTLLGENNIWADTGDTTLTYMARG